MALFLILSGILLIVASVKNTQGTLFTQLSTDIPGYWHLALAIMVLGAIGFIPRSRPISIGLMALFMIAILESQGNNVFANIIAAVNGETAVNAASITSGATDSW